MADLFIPVMICGVMLYALIKGVDAYSSFVAGAKGALPLMASLMPFIISMFVAVELFRHSGLSAVLCNIFPGSPLYCYFGTCSIRNTLICSSSQITGTG